MPIVSIVKGKDPLKMVKEAIKLLNGIDAFVKPHDKVLIKPNLCTLKKPETGATTDPRIVRSIIELIQPITSDISIIESNVAGVEAEMVWALCGYHDLAEEMDVNLVNLSKEPTVVWGGYRLPKILFDDYILVDVPKIKTNEITLMTCGLKNLFGTCPSRHRAKYHKVIDRVIVDLNKAFRSDLVVVDALIGMEGNGPTAGDPVDMGLVIAGDNVVAVDTVVSTVMGLNPNEVLHIMKAAEAGLGTADMSHITLKGEDIKKVKRRFKLPSSIPLTRRLKYKLMERSEMLGIRQAVKLLSLWRRRKYLKKQ